jgi:hypothetical protein
VALLRRILYWQAVLWSISGVLLAFAPGFTIERLLDQPPVGESAWLRAGGAMAIALAAQMVLVAHRIEDLWWWSWTFVLLEIGVAVALVTAGPIGLPDGTPAWPWWVLGAANAGVAALEVGALARAGTERSPR